MIIYGVSANEHDAALAVSRDNKILFASQAERYSRLKNDRDLNVSLLRDAAAAGSPDLIVWYEKPFRKRLKGTSRSVQDALRADGKQYLAKFRLTAPVRFFQHHECHAAAVSYLVRFDEAAIL